MSGASYGGRAGYGNNQQPPALGQTGGGWSTSTNYAPGSMGGGDKPPALWGGAYTQPVGTGGGGFLPTTGQPTNGSSPPMGGGTMTQLPGQPGSGAGGAFGQTGNMSGGQPQFGPTPLYNSGYGSYHAPETPQAPGPGWNLDPVSPDQAMAMHMHGLQGQANYRAANPNAFDAQGNPLWQQQLAQTRAAADARAAAFQPYVNRSLKPMMPPPDPGMNVAGDPAFMRGGVGTMGGPFNTGINGGLNRDPRSAFMPPPDQLGFAGRNRGLLGY